MSVHANYSQVCVYGQLFLSLGLCAYEFFACLCACATVCLPLCTDIVLCAPVRVDLFDCIICQPLSIVFLLVNIAVDNRCFGKEDVGSPAL